MSRLVIETLLVGVGTLAVFLCLRWALLQMAMVSCRHSTYVATKVYHRPARKFFRREVGYPCISCGYIKPVEELRMENE